MNTKPFVAITIFFILFSITTYSLENSALAESKYKTQENSQTTVKPLTGKWSGKSTWTAKYYKYPSEITCYYEGTFILNLRQKQNKVSGDAETENVLLSGADAENCDESISPKGAVNLTVQGTRFSGTVGRVRIRNAKFTSDEMEGKFSSNTGGVKIRGEFDASRVSSSSQ